MRIGIIGSIAKPISLLSTGGTEVFSALIAIGLKNKGHKVSLFATADSLPNKQLDGIQFISIADKSIQNLRADFIKQYHRDFNSEEKSKLIACLNQRSIIKSLKLENELDIFHDNTCSYLVGSASDLFHVPIVTTLHMPPSAFSHYTTLPKLIITPKNHYISISRWEQEHASIPSDLIYNGIRVEDYIFSENSLNYGAWIGRIDPKTPKGLKEAILASKLNHFQLIFSGYITDNDYFEKEIKVLLEPNIQQVAAFSSLQEKSNFFNQAKFSIFPIQWEEPFGLVFIESMACGTPVVAFARGSVPEVIKDGETGFIVNSSPDDIRGDWIIKKTGIEGLCEAVERIYAMPENEYRQMRRACRAHVEKNFTVEKMVDQYEEVYKKILSNTIQY